MNILGQNDTNAPNVRRIHFLTPALLQGLAWPFGRFAVDFFARLKIEGRQNIREAEKYSREHNVGVIFAVNHTHELDFLFPLVAIPPFTYLFPMFYVAHDRLQYSTKKGFGWRRHIYGSPAFLKAWGAHPFVAEQRDYKRALAYHEKLLRHKKSVCIFPEGKIKKDNESRRIHGGVGYLADATGAPVLPVTVSGARGMSVRDFLLRKHKVQVTYGKPLIRNDIIDTNTEVPDRYQNAAKKIMDSMSLDSH